MFRPPKTGSLSADAPGRKTAHFENHKKCKPFAKTSQDFRRIVGYDEENDPEVDFTWIRRKKGTKQSGKGWRPCGKTRFWTDAAFRFWPPGIRSVPTEKIPRNPRRIYAGGTTTRNGFRSGIWKESAEPILRATRFHAFFRTLGPGDTPSISAPRRRWNTGGIPFGFTRPSATILITIMNSPPTATRCFAASSTSFPIWQRKRTEDILWECRTTAAATTRSRSSEAAESS